jgi:hypothetical protein
MLVTVGVMVIFVFVVDDVVMLVTSAISGAMVVACFVVDDVLIFAVGEVRSPCCHIGEATKNMRPTNQSVT